MRSTEALSAEAEAALVGRMRGGDMAARDALAASMLPMVRSLARQFAGVVDRADLAQEGHVAVLLALASFDPARGRLAPYAWARIRGAMLDAIEAHRMRQQPWESGVDDETPADVAERGAWAARALASLSAFERSVIELRSDGATWKQIAYRLGITAVYARQIGSRAMRKLRNVE